MLDNIVGCPLSSNNTIFLPSSNGLPWWFRGTESTCQCRRQRRCGFDPLVGKIPWSRRWQPTPVFLLKKPHGQRNLAGYSPWGCKESDANVHAHTHTDQIYRCISQGRSPGEGKGYPLQYSGLQNSMYCIQLMGSQKVRHE